MDERFLKVAVASAKLATNQKLLVVQQNGRNVQNGDVQATDNLVSISMTRESEEISKPSKATVEKPRAAKLVDFSKNLVSFELFNSGDAIVRIVKTDGGVNKKILVSNAQRGVNLVSWGAEGSIVGNYLIHIEQGIASSAFNVKLR